VGGGGEEWLFGMGQLVGERGVEGGSEGGGEGVGDGGGLCFPRYWERGCGWG